MFFLFCCCCFKIKCIIVLLFAENQSYFFEKSHLLYSSWVVFEGTCVRPRGRGGFLCVRPLHLKPAGDWNFSFFSRGVTPDPPFRDHTSGGGEKNSKGSEGQLGGVTAAALTAVRSTQSARTRKTNERMHRTSRLAVSFPISRFPHQYRRHVEEV